MIFTRRALQCRLDHMRLILPKEVVAWTKRLNNHRRDRLAAMWEVVIIHALAQEGRVVVEPTLSSGRRPDVAFIGSIDFVADITAVSDEGLDDANPYSLLSAEIERAKTKLGLPIGGVHLDVMPKEVTTRRGRKRTLRLPGRARITDLVRDRIIPVLKLQLAEGLTVLKVTIDDEIAGFTLTIDPSRSPYSGGGHAAYTVPTIKDDNPLQRALKAKADQVRDPDSRSGVVVCDGASDTLRAGHIGHSAVPVTTIVQDILRQHSSIDFVLVVRVLERQRGIGGAAPTERWVEPQLFTRPGCADAAALDALFRAAIAHLPRPAMSATNGAMRAREADYWAGHHGGYAMSGGKITISARELLEVLAGQRTLADQGAKNVAAARALGHRQPPHLEEAFVRMLRQGRLPSEIRVIKGGDDDNDDWIEFEFGSPDPAISPLR